MRQYKTAVFDLDGTILDTLDDLTASVNFALESYHLPPRTKDHVRLTTGNGIRRLIDLSVPEGTPAALTDQVFEAFKTHYSVHCEDATHPYQGIPQALKTLKDLGIQTAVCSNKADPAVQKLIAQIFPGLFDFVVGEKEGVRRKPAPDMVYACLKALNATKEDSLFFGDSEVDITTAKNAQVNCVAVAWGFRSRDVQKKAGASVFIDDPSEIVSFFAAD